MPEYKWDMLGTVTELWPLKKAIITFRSQDRDHRALLWGHRLACRDGRPLPEDFSIETELAIGDEVIFDCHTYDHSSQDRCEWYVVRAQLAADAPTDSSFVSNVTATVDELTPTRGFLLFRRLGQGSDQQRAVFVTARVFVHGRRLPAGSSLYDLLEEGKMVHMDAVYGDGLLENAEWYAPLVWQGQRPDVQLDHEPPLEVLADVEDDVASRQLYSLTDGFPALSSAGQQATRLPQMEEKWGYVAHVLGAEYGVLMYQVKPRQYESVLFHRSAAHLFDLNLKNYDLRDIFKKGDHLRFEAERSEHPDAYRWKASSVWVESSEQFPRP